MAPSQLVNNKPAVGFPVVNRYVWGMYGSQFVIWNRIFLSISESFPFPNSVITVLIGSSMV